MGALITAAHNSCLKTATKESQRRIVIHRHKGREHACISSSLVQHVMQPGSSTLTGACWTKFALQTCTVRCLQDTAQRTDSLACAARPGANVMTEQKECQLCWGSPMHAVWAASSSPTLCVHRPTQDSIRNSSHLSCCCYNQNIPSIQQLHVPHHPPALINVCT